MVSINRIEITLFIIFTHIGEELRKRRKLIMNKLFTKIAVVSAGFALAIGVGAAALSRNSFAETKAATILDYTLDGSEGDSSEGSTNGYATESTITQSGLEWGVFGNTTISPWRIGGKNLSSTERTITSHAAVTANDVNKVSLNIGAVSNAKLSVNSITLKVGSTQGGSEVSSIEKTSYTANTDLVFTRPDGKSWASRYFTISIAFTNSANSNYFVPFNYLKFSHDVEVLVPDTITVAGDNEVNVGGNVTLTATAKKAGSTEGVNQNVVWTSSDETVAWVSETGVVTGIGNGSTTIRAASEDDNSVYGELAVTVSGGKTDDTALVMTSESGFATSYGGDKYVAVSGVYLHYNSAMKNSLTGTIQFKTNDGLLENVIALPEDIDTIELTLDASNTSTGFKVWGSADGSSYTELSSNVLYTNTAYYVPEAGVHFFRVTGPTAGTLYLKEILISLGNSAEQKGVSLSADLNTKLDTLCKGDSDTAAVTASEWAEVKAIYDAGDTDAKAFLAGVDGASYIRVNRFLERYDYIVTTYGHENFLGRTLSSPAMNNVNNANTMIVVIVISVISTISLAGLAALLVLKKRKQY